jgi:hypothetical protein
MRHAAEFMDAQARACRTSRIAAYANCLVDCRAFPIDLARRLRLGEGGTGVILCVSFWWRRFAPGFAAV